MSRSSIFLSKETSHRPGRLLIHALAVQRPNESNPLGLCCDIVRPVLGGVLSHLAKTPSPSERIPLPAPTSSGRRLGIVHPSDSPRGKM